MMKTNITKAIYTTMKTKTILASIAFLLGGISASAQKSWTADNGNGTYTNPLLYDEFSDPDIIRVGDDYYLAGTTMHTVPIASPMPALRFVRCFL